VGGADDDDVVADSGGALRPMSQCEVEAGLIELGLQIDDAIAAERAEPATGLRIQCDEV
jgi:hypothetical protein